MLLTLLMVFDRGVDPECGFHDRPQCAEDVLRQVPPGRVEGPADLFAPLRGHLDVLGAELGTDVVGDLAR